MMGKTGGLETVMAGEDDRDLAGCVYLLEDTDNGGLIFNIHAGGGFVAEQNFWGQGQPPGQGDSLGFSAGKPLGWFVFEQGEINHFKDFINDALPLLALNFAYF